MQGTVLVAENELIGGGKEISNEGLGSYFPQKKMLRQGFQGLDSFKTALSEDSGKGRQEREEARQRCKVPEALPLFGAGCLALLDMDGKQICRYFCS